jgi:hypothetical protein
MRSPQISLQSARLLTKPATHRLSNETLPESISSTNTSEFASSSATSPSLGPIEKSTVQSALLAPGRTTTPSPADFAAHINPFLLPSARYPNTGVDKISNLDLAGTEAGIERGRSGAMASRYSFENLRSSSANPMRKRSESRVAFSDEASIISDTQTTKSETTETDANSSDAESVETDATPRPTARQLSSKSSMKKATHSRSVSVPLNRKKIRANKSPAPHSSKPPSRKIPTKDNSDDDSASEDIILSSITDAIPNLHILLENYKKAHGQIDKRQRLVKKLEGRFSEILKSKDDTIQRLMQQSEDAARSRADETGKLQTRIEELESTNLDLEAELAVSQKQLADAQKRANSADKARDIIGKENERIVGERRRFAEVAKADRDKTVASTKMILREDFETEKRRMEERFNEELGELEDRLSQTDKRRTIEFDKERKDITDEHRGHISSLKSRIHDLENKLNQTTKSYEKVRAELEGNWIEEKAQIQKDHAEEITKLKEHHQIYINDQIKGFVSIQEHLNKAYIVENDTLKQQLVGIQLALTPPPPPSVEDGPEDEPNVEIELNNDFACGETGMTDAGSY